MPKPYSYDLRQKAIQAIKLDGPKISEAGQLFNVRVATPLTYGFRGKPKLGTPFALPNQPKGNGHKITAGENFSSGKLKLMAIKPKSR
jgi:transposase